MKSKFSLFGIDVQVSKQKRDQFYSVVCTPVEQELEPTEFTDGYPTYAQAYKEGRRHARRLAREEGRSYYFVLFEGYPHPDNHLETYSVPVLTIVLPVVKHHSK